MSVHFQEIIFEKVIKILPIINTKEYNFNYWFSTNLKGIYTGDISYRLMVRCPKCRTVFCLVDTIYDRDIRIAAIQESPELYYNSIIIHCKKCNPPMGGIVYIR